ncbi:hypothetical protein TNCV_3379441 [Trichonephila clavipes]|nr:hypothetical protein TNCV_3379441 [Trichonephila clavipes]
MNGDSSFFQRKTGSVYSIKIVASVFGGIVANTHSSLSYWPILWCAIGYMSRSPLVRIDGTLNSARYISGVLQPVVLPFIRALRNTTFQQLMHYRMVPVFIGLSLVWKMFSCCPGLHVLQISRQQKKPCLWLPSV